MESCPKELEPFEKAHKMRIQEQDYMNWLSGQYMLSAVSVAVEHCLAGKKARSEYMEKPIMELKEEKETKKIQKELTEEEKKEKTEKLFMQLRIMGANFNINKEK